MRSSSRILAAMLTGCLVWTTVCPQAWAQSNFSVQRKVEVFGPGAEVKLKLSSGTKLDGSITAVGSESFELLDDQDQPPIKIPYVAVRQMEVQKAMPRTPEDARRVIEGNLNNRVQVKVASGKKRQGNIFRLGPQDFELVPDGKTQTLKIAYADLQEVRPRPFRVTRKSAFSSLPKFMLGGGIILGLLVLRCSRDKSCGDMP
jgi:hypothetical protein